MGNHQQHANKFFELLNQKQDGGINTKILHVKRNEYLTRSGQIDPNLYLVLKGSFRVFHETSQEDFTIRFGYPGSFLAVLPTFFNGAPSEYNIQALKASQVKVIHRDHFFEILADHPDLNSLWHQSLQLLVLDQLEREIDLLTSSPELRFERVWNRSPKLFQEIPYKYIASYLRMTPETLSRLKKRYFEKNNSTTN